MMLRLFLAVFAALLIQLPAAAQDAPADMAGNWTFGIGPAGIFQFRMEREGEDWRCIWLRPKSFASNGVIFLNVQGPPIDVPASQVREVNGWLELTFDDPRPGAVPDIFLLRVLADGTAEAVYADTGFPPFSLVNDRAERGIGPWDSKAAYKRAGFDEAVVGPPVQFSSGTSAIANKLAQLIESQQGQDTQAPEEREAVAAPAAPEPPVPVPQQQQLPDARDLPPPMMEGR